MGSQVRVLYRAPKRSHPFWGAIFLLYGPRCAPAALFVRQASLDGMGSAAEAPPAPVTARELASGCRNKCPWGTADEARRQKGSGPPVAPHKGRERRLPRRGHRFESCTRPPAPRNDPLTHPGTGPPAAPAAAGARPPSPPAPSPPISDGRPGPAADRAPGPGCGSVRPPGDTGRDRRRRLP